MLVGPEGQGHGRMGLAHAERTQQQNVGVLGHQGQAGQLLDLLLSMGGWREKTNRSTKLHRVKSLSYQLRSGSVTAALLSGKERLKGVPIDGVKDEKVPAGKRGIFFSVEPSLQEAAATGRDTPKGYTLRVSAYPFPLPACRVSCVRQRGHLGFGAAGPIKLSRGMSPHRHSRSTEVRGPRKA